MAISSSHSQHLDSGPLVAPTQDREVGWTPMATPLVHPLKGSDPLNVSHIKFSPLRHGLFSVFTGPSTWENLRKMDRGINCVAPTAAVGFKATLIPNTSLLHHPFQSVLNSPSGFGSLSPCAHQAMLPSLTLYFAPLFDLGLFCIFPVTT